MRPDFTSKAKYRQLKPSQRMEIHHMSLGTPPVEANDMSEGGVYLMLHGCFQLDVSVRSMGLGVDGNATGPAKPLLRPPQR
jgi:hypothetical protein